MKTALIPLTKRRYAVVDESIFEFAMNHKWHISVRKHTSYARTWIPLPIGRVLVSLHHLVVGFPLNGLVVDHINGDGLDNRSVNLRIVSQRENMSNYHGKKTSIFTGVSMCEETKKWRAHIMLDGKPRALGSFDLETDAAKAYRDALCREV